MKQAKFIITHLKSTPNMKNLQKMQSYKKLLLFLPKSLTRGIYFMYNKNDTLFLVLKHQLYLMEYKSIQRSGKYKQNYIKTKLKELVSLDSTCKCIDAEEVKAFVTNKPQIPLMVSNSLPIYEEKSKAKFTNNIKNKKIHKLFEDIREIICSKKP